MDAVNLDAPPPQRYLDCGRGRLCLPVMRMSRPLRSTIQVRANERSAALNALEPALLDRRV